MTARVSSISRIQALVSLSIVCRQSDVRMRLVFVRGAVRRQGRVNEIFFRQNVAPFCRQRANGLVDPVTRLVSQMQHLKDIGERPCVEISKPTVASLARQIGVRQEEIYKACSQLPHRDQRQTQLFN